MQDPAKMEHIATPSSIPSPVKVFIYYKHNVEPDHSLSTRVFEALQSGRAQGFHLFIDRTMTVGQEWAKEIESNVRSSQCLIVARDQSVGERLRNPLGHTAAESRRPCELCWGTETDSAGARN